MFRVWDKKILVKEYFKDNNRGECVKVSPRDVACVLATRIGCRWWRMCDHLSYGFSHLPLQLFATSPRERSMSSKTHFKHGTIHYHHNSRGTCSLLRKLLREIIQYDMALAQEERERENDISGRPTLPLFREIRQRRRDHLKVIHSTPTSSEMLNSSTTL